MCVVIQLPPLNCERDTEAPPVIGMIDAFNETFLFQLVDDTGHRAQPDVEVGRELSHRPWPLTVEDAQAVRLGHRQRAVQVVIETPELIELGKGVQSVGQPDQILGHDAILRDSYYTDQVVKWHPGLGRIPQHYGVSQDLSGVRVEGTALALRSASAAWVPSATVSSPWRQVESRDSHPVRSDYKLATRTSRSAISDLPWIQGQLFRGLGSRRGAGCV